MKTKHFSWKHGQMAEGCRLCVQGKKLVLFVTGLCSCNCFYCPISEQKKNRDVVFANEWPTNNVRNIIREAELCSAKGAGITGGDPLVRVNRTVFYIKQLKKHFGKKFHIHLYTPLNHVNQCNLDKLFSAGLDELRLHPHSKSEWGKIILARKYTWKLGVEIPVIPGKGKETKELISFLKGKVDFLNLNELEQSDTNAQSLVKKGLRTAGVYSYAVKGSDSLGKNLLKYAASKGMNVHYCTVKLKDGVQLAKRIRRRSKKAKKPYDSCTREGMLVRGAIYNAMPRHVYALRNMFKIPKPLIEYDHYRKRILTTEEVVVKLKSELKKMNLFPAIVEEYPTWDCLNIETEFL